MKCKLCFKDLSPNHKLCSNLSLSNKQNQIQSLNNVISEQKIKVNLNLSKLNALKAEIQTFQSSFDTKTQQQKFTLKNQKKTFNQTLDSICKRQNSLIKIKILKEKIKSKNILLQKRKLRLNQNLQKLSDSKKSISKIKQKIYQKFEIQTQKLKGKIKEKNEFLNSLSNFLKIYFLQVVDKDFGSLWNIQKDFIDLEKKTVLRIKKADELEFSNNSRPEDWMAQSIFELDNIEEVFFKRKLSQKILHLLYQNIILLTILKKLCEFWQPYPINCRINFLSSKLISKVNDICIYDQKMIDFKNSTKLSNNIIQIFPQQLQKNDSNDHKKESQDKQRKLSSQNDQSQEYYKRKYQINKSFANCLQVNLQFLSIKFGIQNRPLLFLDTSLINKIIQDYQWKNFSSHKNQTTNIPVNILGKKYSSMLKEIQVSKFLQIVKDKTNKKQKNVGKILEEGEIENESESSDMIERSENNESQSSWNWPSIKQSVYQIMVPQSLQNVKSNDTDNDEFQLLTF